MLPFSKYSIGLSFGRYIVEEKLGETTFRIDHNGNAAYSGQRRSITFTSSFLFSIEDEDEVTNDYPQPLTTDPVDPPFRLILKENLVLSMSI